ncbi:conserved hypothetical protein [Histoplasma mississippiense (nom. inval.)]|uniref:conserved hypothetical protein n=1 Tax=Ajellomyces capsulatus (strain NAm1 / WU24) TaxID=2059318 RepID=UPI000157C22C|nr:conserved hypothetical protein [Histoplasma mississippiense (nom. inval.)]EDN07195.1 conserved hypothetical protein [Histoplasma mississippiense (nom. inval.)]
MDSKKKDDKLLGSDEGSLSLGIPAPPQNTTDTTSSGSGGENAEVPPALPPRPNIVGLDKQVSVAGCPSKIRPSSKHNLQSKPTTALSLTDINTQNPSDGSREPPLSSGVKITTGVTVGHRLSGTHLRSRRGSDAGDSISVRSFVPSGETSDDMSLFGDFPVIGGKDFSWPEGGENTGKPDLLESEDDEVDYDFENEFDAIDEVEPDDSNSAHVVEAWKQKRKHFLILSQAGKPIYTRHGDSGLISDYIGIIQTIISFYEESGDSLKSFSVGKGTEPLLSSLADSFTRGSPSTLLSALECLKIRKSHRQTINNSLLKTRADSLLYGLVVAGGRLVSVIRPKKHSLHPGDLRLIFNMIFEADGVKAGGGDSWIPVCLPGFNSSGYLYMYVSFLDLRDDGNHTANQDTNKDDSVAIILISADKESFYVLREMRDSVVERMTKNGSIDIIKAAIEKGRPTTTDIVPGTVLRHFLYKSKANVQFSMASYYPDFSTTLGRRRLLSIYHSLHSSVHAKHAHVRVEHRTTNSMNALAWITPVFELYCVAGPNSNRNALSQSASKIAQWAQQEEERLFIIGGAVF